MVADLHYLTPEELDEYTELRKIGLKTLEKVYQEDDDNPYSEEQQRQINEGLQKYFASQEMVSKAEKRELEFYSTDIDSMMKGALIQLDRAINYTVRETANAFYELRYDTIFIYEDFEKQIRIGCLEPFIDYISKYPEYMDKLNQAISDACKKYPSQMIIYEKDYPRREEEVQELELGEPIMQTKYGFIYAYKDIDFNSIGIDVFAEDDENDEQALQAEIIPKINPRKVGELVLATDKVSRALWNMIPSKKARRVSAESAADRKAGKRGDIVVIVNPDINIKYSRHLTSYERRIVTVIGSYHLAGRKFVSAGQIYREVFQDTNPNKRDVQKILDTIDELNSVRVVIDNREEVEKLHYKYPLVQIKGTLLATTMVTATLAGNVISNAIRIDKLPPNVEFAIDRNQYTKIPAKVYRVPELNQTEQTMRVIDYLIDRIAAMRYSEDVTRTIAITSLCEKCEITSKGTISKLPKKLGLILNHFKREKFIKDYTLDGNNIIIKTPPSTKGRKLTAK